MRTRVTIDDALFNEATCLAGSTEKGAVIREGLKALIERESARRLALLGGTETHLGNIIRRRSEPNS